MAVDVEVVTYDGLPASAGGAHSLRAKNPSSAHEQVQRFIDAAVRTPTEPTMTFQLWSGGPPRIAASFESFAAAQLGGPQRRERTHTVWRVRADDTDAVLEAVSGAGSDAVTSHGHPLASLVWNAKATLFDPMTGRPYEGLGEDAFGGFAVDGYGRLLGASGVRATFGTTASSLSLWLAFPGDDRLEDAAAHVQANLPFRLSAKHWRRWRATRDGQCYRATKIASPLTA